MRPACGGTASLDWVSNDYLKIIGMKRILFFTIMLALVSCSDWVKPESLSYMPQRPSESDPDGYANHLAAVKAYKNTEHNVMILGMLGTADAPVSRPQHLMNMPDSADFIYIQDAVNLHSSLVSEIREVYETKGTRTLLYVDFAVIEEEWTVLEDAKVDAGKPAGTAAEAEAFFKEKTQAQIENFSKYGFSGVVVSFEGNTSGNRAYMQKGFLGVVCDWHKANPDAIIILRGTIRNIEYTDPEYKKLIDDSMYQMVVSTEGSTSAVEINKQVTRILSYVPEKQRRVVFETTVPSVATPEQTGATPQVAAEWVLKEKNSSNFTPYGISVGNAYDDYYRQEQIYKNARAAITIMNPVVTE